MVEKHSREAWLIARVEAQKKSEGKNIPEKPDEQGCGVNYLTVKLYHMRMERVQSAFGLNGIEND